MLVEIKRDEAHHTAHFTNKPRHTMQLDWYVYEDDLRRREIPAGEARARAQQGGATAIPARGVSTVSR